MRVIHVITRLIVGGAQENTVATVLGLREKPGVHVSLISGPSTGPEGSMDASLSSASIHPQILPELVRPVHPWMDFMAWRKLTKAFRSQQPDIVHTHSGKAGCARSVGRPKSRCSRGHPHHPWPFLRSIPRHSRKPGIFVLRRKRQGLRRPTL